MTSPSFSLKRRTIAAALAAGMLSLALVGCSDDKPAFKGSDVTGTHLGKDMAMTDSSGRVRTLADYQGKVVVVYFGHTHCPDVCPTSMVDLAQVMQVLKHDAIKVQFNLISVDPARDPPATMHNSAKAFSPTFIRLMRHPDPPTNAPHTYKELYP